MIDMIDMIDMIGMIVMLVRSLVLPSSGSLTIKRIDGEFAVYCDGNLVGCNHEAIFTVFEKIQLVEAKDLPFFNILRKFVIRSALY
jgi:hypothetical protein